MIPKVGDKVKITFDDSVEYGVVFSIDRIVDPDDFEVYYCIALESHSRYTINEQCMDEMCKIIEDCICTEPIDMDKIMTKHIVTPKNEVDIHKIIDDAMIKKDRAVHILILPTSTSVNVTPYSGETRAWIIDHNNNLRCPECGTTRRIPTVYCPECGEKLCKPEDYKGVTI